jgi:hypothetical protein
MRRPRRITAVRLESWTQRSGLFVLGLGILEHSNWAKITGFALIVVSTAVDVIRKIVRRTQTEKHI